MLKGGRGEPHDKLTPFKNTQPFDKRAHNLRIFEAQSPRQDTQRPTRLPFSSSCTPPPFVLSIMGKTILTVRDKHRPNAGKHKREAREGESFCRVHALPLQPCLVCTLGRWQDLMFHLLLSRSLTATPSAAVIPVYPVVRNSMQCAVGLLCIFQVKVCAATNNRKRGINQSSRLRRRMCFSLVISCLILCLRPCPLSQLLN